MVNLGFPKLKLNPNLNESANLSDFGFAKNCRYPTTFRFRLRHIPVKKILKASRIVNSK